MRRTVRLRISKPSWSDAWWYKRTYQPLPMSMSKTLWSTKVMRFVPYRFRALHHFYATLMGFFWIPCVLCDFPFGGHESGGTIPDPLRNPGGGTMICSQCGRENKGVSDW